MRKTFSNYYSSVLPLFSYVMNYTKIYYLKWQPFSHLRICGWEIHILRDGVPLCAQGPLRGRCQSAGRCGSATPGLEESNHPPPVMCCWWGPGPDHKQKMTPRTVARLDRSLIFTIGRLFDLEWNAFTLPKKNSPGSWTQASVLHHHSRPFPQGSSQHSSCPRVIIPEREREKVPKLKIAVFII